MLCQSLELVGCSTRHAKGDADALIVETTVQSAMSCETTLVGDDTDLLVLLCLQQYVFAHAILGCDTTSRVFGMEKGLAQKHIRSDKHIITQAEVFLQENATLADISSAGEAALVCLYTGAVGDTLFVLLRFHQKVATSTRFVQSEHLPPTSSAAKYHSLRVYLQVQIWKGESRLGPHLHPQNLGWKAVEGKVVPIQCDMDVAPKALLKVVRCNCTMGCDTLRCSCRKAGLECSTGCGECRGICANLCMRT